MNPAHSRGREASGETSGAAAAASTAARREGGTREASLCRTYPGDLVHLQVNPQTVQQLCENFDCRAGNDGAGSTGLIQGSHSRWRLRGWGAERIQTSVLILPPEHCEGRWRETRESPSVFPLALPLIHTECASAHAHQGHSTHAHQGHSTHAHQGHSTYTSRSPHTHTKVTAHTGTKVTVHTHTKVTVHTHTKVTAHMHTKVTAHTHQGHSTPK